MKFLSICLLVLFIACSGPKKNGAEDSVATDQLTPQGSFSLPDTIKIGDMTFQVETISPEEFGSPSQSRVDDLKETKLTNDAKSVKRIGDSLVFILKNGKRATFLNTKGESFSNYFYLGKAEGLNQFMVKGAFDEWSTTYLINDLSGDTTEICGAPKVSPGNKFVMGVNADLVAGFNFNGFDLFKLENGSLKKLGRREVSHWGPHDFKWVSDKEALVEIRVAQKDTVKGTLDKPAFIKLRMN